jgi:hypothetical protein
MMMTWEMRLNSLHPSAQSENRFARVELEYLVSGTNPETSSGKLAPIAFASVVQHHRVRVQVQRR